MHFYQESEDTLKQEEAFATEARDSRLPLPLSRRNQKSRPFKGGLEINLDPESGRIGDGAQTGDTPDCDRDALGVVRGIRLAGNRVERLNIIGRTN